MANVRAPCESLVHHVAHAMGSLYHIPHGEANGVLLPIVMETLADFYAPNAERLAEVMGIATEGKTGTEWLPLVVAAIREFQAHYIGSDSWCDSEGWESLGDMGHLAADGYLYVADRQTDVVISGGANIFPAEVEAAIESYIGVLSCAVIGLPDADLGNKLHAIIYAPDVDVSAEAMAVHLADYLVRYKIPRTFEFVDAPVRDEAGKVRRKALREERLEITYKSLPRFIE